MKGFVLGGGGGVRGCESIRVGALVQVSEDAMCALPCGA